MLPGQCSWFSQLGRPQNRTGHKTAWWKCVLFLPSVKIKVSDDWKKYKTLAQTSQCHKASKVQERNHWRLPDDRDSLSLMVVGAVLWLWNSETVSYLTLCPMMGQAPPKPLVTGYVQLSVCLERKRGGGVHIFCVSWFWNGPLVWLYIMTSKWICVTGCKGVLAIILKSWFKIDRY